MRTLIFLASLAAALSSGGLFAAPPDPRTDRSRLKPPAPIAKALAQYGQAINSYGLNARKANAGEISSKTPHWLSEYRSELLQELDKFRAAQGKKSFQELADDADSPPWIRYYTGGIRQLLEDAKLIKPDTTDYSYCQKLKPMSCPIECYIGPSSCEGLCSADVICEKPTHSPFPSPLDKTVQQYVQILRNSPDAASRAQAAAALYSMKKAAKDAAPELVQALFHDPDKGVQQQASLALQGLGPDAIEALPALENALAKNPNKDARERAMQILGSIRAKESVPSLARALDTDTDAWVRFTAAEVLMHIGEDAAPAIPALEKSMIKDSDSSVRASAARALGYIGPKAREAIPFLQQALHDDKVRKDAADALYMIDPSAKGAIAPPPSRTPKLLR